MNTNKTSAEILADALAAARDAEARNLSAATQNKRWRAVFAAEDAVKASGAWA